MHKVSNQWRTWGGGRDQGGKCTWMPPSRGQSHDRLPPSPAPAPPPRPRKCFVQLQAVPASDGWRNLALLQACSSARFLQVSEDLSAIGSSVKLSNFTLLQEAPTSSNTWRGQVRLWTASFPPFLKQEREEEDPKTPCPNNCGDVTQSSPGLGSGRLGCSPRAPKPWHDHCSDSVPD